MVETSPAVHLRLFIPWPELLSTDILRWLLVHVCKYSSHCVDWTHSFSPQRLINEDMPSTQSIKRNGTLTLSSCEAYNEVGGGNGQHGLASFSYLFHNVFRKSLQFHTPGTGSEGMIHRGLQKEMTFRLKCWGWRGVSWTKREEKKVLRGMWRCKCRRQLAG